MAPRILIDADGCPVVDLTVRIARENGVACLIVCDTSHSFHKPGATTLIVSKGVDSVDFALVNRIAHGDIVVTQDYGLAAMCLSKGARVLRQDGLEYTADNMNALLMARHTAKKLRRAGGRLHGSAKRTKDEDRKFAQTLTCVLAGCIKATEEHKQKLE